MTTPSIETQTELAVLQARELVPLHLFLLLAGGVADTFKYHVSCTGEKISVRINLLFYLFFHSRPIQHLCGSFL